VHRECRQWQHNVELSGSIPLQPAGSSELEEKLPKTPFFRHFVVLPGFSTM
jgi:hypothetical protein